MSESDGKRSGVGENQVARRSLLSWLLGFSVVSTLGGVLFPVASFLWPPARAAVSQGEPTLVGEVDDFPPNSGKVVEVHGKPVMVVNTAAGGLKAFSAICTHLGCVTYWHEQRGVIQCPCHDGRFSPMNGTVLAGPPPRPLPPYELDVVKGQVYVGEAQGVLSPA